MAVKDIKKPEGTVDLLDKNFGDSAVITAMLPELRA